MNDYNNRLYLYLNIDMLLDSRICYFIKNKNR